MLLKIPKRKNRKYDPKIPKQIKRLVKRGHPKEEICKILGVPKTTMLHWINTKSRVRKAFNQGQKTYNKPTVPAFIDYVYDRLPPNLQELWDKLSAWEREPNALRKIEMMMGNQSVLVRQHLWIHALISFNFNPNRACKAIGISIEGIRRWCQEDPNFEKLLSSMKEVKENFFEGALLDLVAKGDSNAIVFCARTQLKHRGYNEKVQIEHEHKGQVKHTHVIGEKELSKLPIAKRLELLNLLDTIDSESSPLAEAALALSDSSK